MNEIQEPERRWILTIDIETAQEAIRCGIENTRELLADRESRFGRITKSNRLTAEWLEAEIDIMQKASDALNSKEMAV